MRMAGCQARSIELRDGFISGINELVVTFVKGIQVLKG
jgi:hypothetical protein